MAFLVIRGVVFAQFGGTLFARRTYLDTDVYFSMASAVAEGRWQQPEAFYLGPGWPYLLGLWFKLTGPSIAAGRVLNMGLSAVTLAALAGIGWRLGRWRAALGLAAIWALFKPAICQEQTLLLETGAATMLALVLAATVWFQDSPRRPVAAVLPALLLGVAALFRANVLVLAPVIFVAVLWPFRTGGAKRLVLAAAAFALGIVLPILPATIHNFRAEKQFVPIAANFGINLWIGLGPDATGGYVVPPSTVGNTDYRGLVHVRKELGREAITSKEIDDFWRESAFRGLTVRRFLDLAATKLSLFFRNQETAQLYHFGVIAEDVPALRLPLPGAAFVVWALPVAMLGLCLRRRPTDLMLAAGALLLVASLLPFFVTDRYRLALAPWLLVASWEGLAALAERLRTTTRRAPTIAAAVALLILPHAIVVLRPADLSGTAAGFRQLEAWQYLREGNHARALELVGPTNATNPTASSLSTEATCVEKLTKDYARAAKLYEQAIALEPQSAQLWFNAAQAQLRCGRNDAGRRSLEEMVRLDPNLSADGWYNLAVLRAMAGDRIAARDALREVLRLRPDDRAAGNMLGELQRWGERRRNQSALPR